MALATTALRGAGSKQLGSSQPKSPLEAAGSAALGGHSDHHHHRSGEPWSLRELDNGHSYTGTGAAINGLQRLPHGGTSTHGRKGSLGHPASNAAQVHNVNLTDFLEHQPRSHSKHQHEPVARTSSKQDAGADLARTKDVQAPHQADTRQPHLPPRETTAHVATAEQHEAHHSERRTSGSKEAAEKSNSVMQWIRASHEINERHNSEETEHIVEDARKRRAAYGHQRSGSHHDGTQAPLSGLAPGSGPPPRPSRRFINVRKKGTAEKGTEGIEPEVPPAEPEEVTEPAVAEAAKPAAAKPAAAIYDAAALWGAKPIKPEAPKPKEEAPKKTGCIFEGVKVGHNDLRERLASKKSSSSRAESKVSTTADSHSESHATST